MNISRNAKPYATASGVLKTWTVGTIGIGVGLDYFSWQNGGLSGSKFALNSSVTAWSTGLGLFGLGTVGIIGSGFYFGIDTFYPGGINGALQKNSSLQEQNQEILGNRFNLYRDF